MKKFSILLTVLILAPMVGFSQQSLYDFKVLTLEGEDFDLSSLKGKKVMVVNVASKCGFTPQYKDLEEMYRNRR